MMSRKTEHRAQPALKRVTGSHKIKIASGVCLHVPPPSIPSSSKIFSSLAMSANLSKLEAHLATRSYVEG